MTFLWFFVTFSWHSHDFLMTFSWLSQDLLVTFSLPFHDFLMTFSWRFVLLSYDWKNVWLTDRLTYWLTYWLTDSLTDFNWHDSLQVSWKSLTVWICHSLCHMCPCFGISFSQDLFLKSFPSDACPTPEDRELNTKSICVLPIGSGPANLHLSWLDWNNSQNLPSTPIYSLVSASIRVTH